jgi:ATP-dependent RNA helicase DeaD
MKSFQELELSSPLMKAITEMGFETPTSIQEQALPILLAEPTDFIGLAATGTGKTVAFGLPLLQNIDTAVRSVQGLILCPTRELALQVAGQIDLLGKHMKVKALPIYGGSPYSDQIRGLRNGATVVVGTPGRIVDHINRGTLDLSNLSTLILDEADEMISMGFKDDLEAILSSAPKEGSNIWLFSATMSREVRRVADKYLKKPEQVEVNRTEMVPDAIEQIYYRAHEGDKPEIICKLIDAADDFYGLIFCQTKALVMDLTQYLKNRNYPVDCLHGDMDQNARERTMLAYRNRQAKIMVCTDVASRGLDVKDITHVINYSLPRELDNYVHRIGRTARSGKTGIAMNLVTPSHRGLIPRIEKMTNSRMKEGRLPTRKEIGTKKISSVLTKFEAQATFARAVDLMDSSWKKAIVEMGREEIVGRFLALTFPEVFEEQREISQPQVAPEASRGGGYAGGRGRDRDEKRSYQGGQGGGYSGGGYRPQARSSGGASASAVGPVVSGSVKIQIRGRDAATARPEGRKFGQRTDQKPGQKFEQKYEKKGFGRPSARY